LFPFLPARQKGEIMGVIWTVVPLLAERRDDYAAWLRESYDIACPAGVGRFPTLPELHAVLDHLEGYTSSWRTGKRGYWYADTVEADTVDGESADMLFIDDNETATYGLGFQRGTPRLMLLILQRLARECGLLMLIPDTGELPVVVTADLDLDQTLLEWEG
jgi:hypothetical protein